MSGHTIINIEPSGLKNNYDSRWYTYSSIKECNLLVDIFYGSHSLEYVQDLGTFESEVKRLVCNDSYIFFEVPHSEHPLMGGGAKW